MTTAIRLNITGFFLMFSLTAIAQPTNQGFNPADASFLNNPASYQGITYSQIAPVATPGLKSISINYPGYFAILNPDGSDVALLYNLQEDNVSITGPADFRFKSEGDAFKLNSMEGDAGIGLFTTSIATITGYLNNVAVSGATGTIDFASANASSGGITYVNNGLGGNGGMLTFNSLWQNLDEVRITGTALAFAIDDLNFSPAVTNPLPVTFYSFTGELEPSNKVRLHWETASEINNRHFIIEHSRDEGRTYQVLGFVNSNRNPAGLASYSFLHETPDAGVNLYRIAQEDLDGEKSFTKSIRIYMQPDEKLILYPNPANNITELRLSDSAPALVQLISTLGQVVHQQRTSQQVIRIPIQHLTSGFYQVVVFQNGRTIKQHLLKY